MTKFCTYWTGYAGECGMHIPEAEYDRCEKHRGKTEPERKVKGVKYSGDSRYRQEKGQFQAKRGR